MAYRLLVENSAPEDSFEYLLEEKDRNAPSTLYIKGPYLMAEKKNRNNRIYPLSEMTREVERYKKDMIDQKRSMGELNHPTSADVNLERACHIIVDLYQEGNVFIGKSKVLSTPCGLVVRSLINDGVRIGVSSRALGQLEEQRGANVVKEMRLVAVDCVWDPSGQQCYVDPLLESKRWVLNTYGQFEEVYEGLEKSLKNLPKKNISSYLTESILDFIKKLSQ